MCHCKASFLLLFLLTCMTQSASSSQLKNSVWKGGVDGGGWEAGEWHSLNMRHQCFLPVCPSHAFLKSLFQVLYSLFCYTGAVWSHCAFFFPSFSPSLCMFCYLRISFISLYACENVFIIYLDSFIRTFYTKPMLLLCNEAVLLFGHYFFLYLCASFSS